MSFVLISGSVVKARKQHKCIACGEAIMTGETYKREASTWDGNFQNHAWHLDCDLQFQEGCDGEEEFLPGSIERPEKPESDSELEAALVGKSEPKETK